MNTKKIWILAVLFGLTMSVVFYIVTVNNNYTTQTVLATAPAEEKKEEEVTIPLSPSLEIAEGKRAISIAVDVVQSVSGFVKPGSIVDVISIGPTETNDQMVSKILLQNVKVLAVGKTLVDTESENEEPYQTITVEVSQAEGASLAYAKEVGTVMLMLKGNEE